MTIPSRPLFDPPADRHQFVLDASVAIGWVVGGRDVDEAFQVVRFVGPACPLVSFVWPGEVFDGAITAERGGRVTAERVNEVLSKFDVFPIVVDGQRLHLTWPAVLAVARRYRLRVGPAAALELALRTQLPLATIDARLRAAATRAGVAIFTP